MTQLNIKEEIKKNIYQSIKDIAKKEKGFKISPEDIHLEHPQIESHGDYASNTALKLGKKLKTNPISLAQEIKERLPQNKNIKKIEIKKPGFINFWLSKKYLLSEFEKVLEEKENYGQSGVYKDQRIMIEFAHPNTHKLFHIGHLRNISLGESLVRLLEITGAEVIRTNYQGDVGLHIAKCLWGIVSNPDYQSGLKKLKTLDQKINFLSKAYIEGNKAYDESPKAKEKIKEINKKIYTREDPEILKLWQETRKWSLEYFDRIYKRVDSKFDKLYFESEMLEGVEIAKGALEKGILEKSKGAVIFNGKPHGVDKRVFITSENLPTYEAKELKLSQLEFSDFGKIDKCIHVVGPEQKSFFSVTFKVEELLDPKTFKDRQYHLAYGWVRLKEGKMSSRQGNIVLAEELLDYAKEKTWEKYQQSLDFLKGKEILEMVGVGAVKYSMLKFAPLTDITFDIDESIALEGNSGPYLQYTHARCQSILQKESVITPKILRLDNIKLNPQEIDILRTIYQFPEAVLESAIHLAPNLLCNYLYTLAQRYNLFYNEHPILRAQRDLKIFRVNLTSAVTQILKNGLYLLGIKAPERM